MLKPPTAGPPMATLIGARFPGAGGGVEGLRCGDTGGGRPRRVSSATADELNPSWSRDGKRIYFFSNRTGRNESGESLSAEGRPNGSPRTAVVALESTDRETLFSNGRPASPLFARSLDGGSERQVLDHVAWSAFAVFEDGIYYLGRPGGDGKYPLQFHEFSTGSSRLITTIEGPLQQFLSVSPDRKTFLFTRHSGAGSDLMLLENFR